MASILSIATKFGPREVDLDKLPAVSLSRAIKIGITNILRDSYASDKTDAARLESMEEALVHFLNGTAAERGRTSDPVEVEARNIAKAILKAKGVKPDADDYKAKLATVMAHPNVVKKAQANVKAASALVDDIEI